MKRLIDDTSGSTVAIVAAAMVMLTGFAALATEGAMWYTTKRTMQGAADSAAYSAAIAKNRPPGTSSIFTSQAKSVASTYGYVDGSGNVTVAVNNPPKSGNYTTNNFAIEVTIKQPQKALFSQMFMAAPPTLNARAVALLSSSSKCMYALNPKSSGAVHVDGGDAITSTCGLAVNSSSSTAVTVSGTLTVPSVDIVGGYSGHINSSYINTGVIPVSDPLFYIQPPTWGNSCDHTKYSIGAGQVTLNPGVYCGGITISGTAGVTLSQGTYILLGGGLSVSGSSTLKGTGVTLYNTGSATHPYQPIQMNDNAVVTLAAPTSGALSGILFFQDRSTVSTAANVLMGAFTGALYFPTTPLVLNSGQDVSVPYTILVADTLSLTVNTLKINHDYTSLANGSPIKEPKLVE